MYLYFPIWRSNNYTYYRKVMLDIRVMQKSPLNWVILYNFEKIKVNRNLSNGILTKPNKEHVWYFKSK